MDARDVTDKVPVEIIYTGKVLEEIFLLQGKLNVRYVKLEKLPPYPIDIDLRESQTLIKDFISRMIEELAEGFESYNKMLEFDAFNREKRNERKYIEQEDLLPHLQNFNEELSDALHFLVELLLYCNIDADDIHNYYKLLLEEKELHDVLYFENDLMATIMGYARHCNLQENLYDIRIFGGSKIIPDRELRDEFLRGGRVLSPAVLEEQKKQLWDIVYQFNLARNMLKNKSWKQTEMMTDSNRFQEQLMEGFLYFVKYLDFVGMTVESIFTIYFKKNKINNFRIDSQY